MAQGIRGGAHIVMSAILSSVSGDPEVGGYVVQGEL